MKSRVINSLKFAFPRTLPIMAGFLFLGISYGIMMANSGFSFLYPLSMSIFIFGGSLEFVVATWLTTSFNPLQSFFLSFLIQSRHLFYGITLIDKYKGVGLKKAYLIYALCDETFSINCAVDVPENIDRGWFYFFISLFNQVYWVAGATIGGIFGTLININIKGLDFIMTAMFVVFLIDQLKKEKQPYTAIIGIICSVGALLIFGADNFLIYSMCIILALLLLIRKPLEKGGLV